MPEPKPQDAVSILFVCMGNICRSPTAEGVVRRAASGFSLPMSLRLDSAGTHHYHIGSPPDPRSIRAARSRGIDISGLRARQLAPRDFDHQDLLLVMDERNRRDVLRIAPGHARHKVRLFLDYAPQAGLREVPDPYSEGPEAFEQVLDLAESASTGLLAALSAGRLTPA